MPPDTMTDASALIVVDMQNDFVRPGAPMAVPDALGTIAAHQRLIACFRSLALPVIFTRFLATERPSLLWRFSPQCAPPLNACKKGFDRYYEDLGAIRECSSIIDELAPDPDELIVEKFGYGAFHETALAAHLDSRGVGRLVFTGTVTQICVEESAREAFHRGYESTIASDAVSSFAPDLHAATLKNFAMKFGWVSSSEDIIARLQQSAAAA